MNWPKILSRFFFALGFILLVIGLCVRRAHGQNIYNYPAGTGSSVLQIIPQAVPSSPTDVIKTDAFIETIQLSNTNGTVVTCTVNDKQASPVALTPGAVQLLANQMMVFPLYGRWAPSGVTWSCSGTGVTGWIKYSRATTPVIVSTTG